MVSKFSELLSIKKSTKLRCFVKLGVLFLVIIILTALTSCSKQAEQPVIAEPEEITDVKETLPEQELEGRIKEAWDYLLQEGLEPGESITQDAEGVELIITWQELCDDTQVMLLNDYLQNAISDWSSHQGYGPVSLRRVTLILKDGKTAADIYFIEGKVCGGVTYPNEEINKEPKDYRSLAGKTLAQIRQIDYPLWEAGDIEKPSIYYISAEQALKEGFEKAVQVQSLGQGRLLITYQKDTESRVYIYDLKKASAFYSGLSFQDYPNFRVEQLREGKAAVILEDKILIVESQSFKLLEEILYPDGERISLDDLDITPDGQTIVYSNNKGLTVSDLHFNHSKVIVEAKIGSDPNGMDSEVPRYPVFSPDSSRILYRMVGYEWLVGTGVINSDGSGHSFVDADSEENHYTQWYDDKHIYSSGPAYGDFRNPLLYNVETGEKTYLVQDAPRDKRIEYYLSANNQLLYQEAGIEEDEGLIFGFIDITSQTWHHLFELPGVNTFDFYSIAYDQDNNTIGFIVHNHPLWSRPAVLVGYK
ncbi:MAG: hypothetical protein ACOX3R_10310 [Desulfitobacteriia bacterium]